MTTDHNEQGQFAERNVAALKHGAGAYEKSGGLPAEMEGFDVVLAEELLELAGGDPAFRLLAVSAARRATLLELAYSWLGRADVSVMWIEAEDGRKVVRWQPILNKLGSFHEGLRRDLVELGLTPLARAKLNLGTGERAVSIAEILEATGDGDDS